MQQLSQHQHYSAEKAVREHAIITLTAHESENFVSTVLHPPKPNDALKNACKRYKKFQMM